MTAPFVPSPWKIRGGELAFSAPSGIGRRVLVMGILNVTPDSFSDGGHFLEPSDAVARAEALLRGGADILDVGGQSTRPGFSAISPEEEWARLERVLPPVCRMATVSVDTFFPEVARRALEAGAHIINDVTGLRSPEMRRVIVRYVCGAVLMRCGELPPGCDPVAAARDFFEEGIALCEADGVDPSRLALDCGVGFGTTREQDRELLLRMGECRVRGLPLLAAASRKRVIAEYYSGSVPPEMRDEGTHVAHGQAVEAGADIVRVHDVPGAVRALRVNG